MSVPSSPASLLSIFESFRYCSSSFLPRHLTTSAGGRGDMSGAGNPVLDGEPLEPLEPFFGEWPSLEGESGVLDGEVAPETFGDAFGDACSMKRYEK